MTVATIQQRQAVSSPTGAALGRWVSVLEPAIILAEHIAGTEFVPAAIRNSAPAIAACVMYGDEIGIGPMQSLASIHVIDGRPSLASELMRGLIYAAGHSLQIVSLNGTSCTLAGKRRDEKEWTEIVWSLEMARNAGLTNKAVWTRYPRAMLLARASSELARIKFPDVVKGLVHFADDESVAVDFESWAATDAPAEQPAPPTRTIERRRASIPASRGGAASSSTVAPDVLAAAAGGSVPTPPDPPAFNMAPPDLPTDPLAPLPADEIPPPAAGPPDAYASAVAASPLSAGGALPEADDAVPDASVSNRLMGAIQAGFKRINCDNRTLRLAITSAIIERRINSANELTRREGLRLVAALSDLETGVRTLHIEPDGTVQIVATDKEG